MLSAAGTTFNWICEDCSRIPCAKVASSVAASPDLAVDVPAQGESCVWLEQIPNGAKKMRVSWEQHVDPWVLARLLIGTVLVWYHLPLRESTSLQAALGGVGSLGVVLIIVGWWLLHSARGAIRGSVPLGGLITSLGMLLCVMLPSLREALIALVRPNSSSDYAAWLSLRDPFFNLPIGWIALISAIVVASSTILLGARWSRSFFASAAEPEGEVGFTIGSDGRRVDLLPGTPLPQRCLGWMIWLIGLVVLLESTYLDACSLGLTLLVLFADSVFFLIHGKFQEVLGSELGPENLRSMISLKTYEEQGKQHTASALAQLKHHVQTHISVMDRMHEDTELRMRRFSHGCGHFHHPGNYSEDGEFSQGWCSIL